MAELIELEVITPEGVKLTEKVSELTAPSADGEFGVLPGHRPMLVAFTTGIVSYIKNGEKHSVAAGPGFIEISSDRAIVLTDRFITKEQLDPVRLRQELKDVDEALDKFHGDPNSPEYAGLVARELWVAAQLELYGDPPPPRVRTLSELQLGAHESYLELGDEASETEPDKTL